MTPRAPRARPVVLVVLDGEVAPRALGDDSTWLRRIGVHSDREPRPPNGLIAAGGSDVGACAGQPACSVAGHVALGAGRVPTTDRARIDAAVEEGLFATNAVLRGTIGRAKELGGRLHLIGLLSAGGAHSSLHHLHALIDLAKSARVRVVLHAVLDGRDVPSGTALKYVADLERSLAGGVGRIGTVGGRFWGMDREQRWERTAKCYRAILAVEVHRADSALRGIEDRYAAGQTDDAVEPFVAFDYPGVSPVDTAIHFNFRADGALQLARALADPRFDGFARKGGRAPFSGRFASLTTLDGPTDVPAAFPKASLPSTLSEVLARAGYRQMRCAGAEQSIQVTSAFNAGREEPFDGETRQILPLPSGPSAAAGKAGTICAAVARAAREAILGKAHDFVLVNLAIRDSATPMLAIDDVGAALDKILDASRCVGGALIVTASHARGEQAGGVPLHPAQEAGRGDMVPLVYLNDADRAVPIRSGGRLCDVAPTVLELLDLPVPPEMTGRSLLDRS